LLQRLWLLFAQVCTVLLALYFTLTTLRPEWLANLRPGGIGSLDSQQARPAASPTLAPAVATNPTTAGNTAPSSFSPAVKRALPAVVSIATSRVDKRRHPLADDPIFGRLFGLQNKGEPRKQQLGEGSGAIVSAEGHVLTNFHVIDGANEITILLPDKREFKCKVVGVDPDTDLAVLKIDKLPAGEALPVIALGDSNTLQVGDVVLAMGNPFGISNTVTMGIVSALGRHVMSETNPFEDFIQTDAAINPGNSGGPLVDVAGNLVGINSSIYTRTGTTAGIGFSIPTTLARPIMEQIIATGEVTRGYFGTSLQTITPELAKNFDLPDSKGALVAAVIDGGPADRAGIKAGDVLIEVAGKPMNDSKEVIAAIAFTKPGEKIDVKVRRGKEKVALNVTVGKRPQRQQP
jgi:Do/DeqQ family serine protease